MAHLVAGAVAVTQNAGLIQALSIVVPETFGCELAQLVSEPEAKNCVAELALDVIAWRDPEKIACPRDLVSSFTTGEQLMALFERIIAVATIPGHPLGADWLNGILTGYSLIERDVIWSTALVRMWDGKGHAHRLVKLAREADLRLLAPKAVHALGVTLCWLLACPDRRVRDEATKGLVRLVMAVPPLSICLLQRFVCSDDDYIVERVLTVAYGAGLLLHDLSYWRDLGEAVGKLVFDGRGGPPTNVLIRDMSRLIVEKWRETDPTCQVSDRCTPPFLSGWPLAISAASWEALRIQHKDFPPNMFIEPQSTSDFADYIAVNKVLKYYDLASVDLTPDAATRWIFEETLRFGYPGAKNWGLAYDWILHRVHGSGRARPSYAERLGKKYAWIHLARIAGHLSDHAPPNRRPWDSTQPPAPLQGVSLRSIDPTVGVTCPLPQPSVQLERFLSQPVLRIHTSDEAAWIAAVGEYEFRPHNDQWTALSVSFSVRQRDGEDPTFSNDFRGEDVRVQAFAAKSAKLRQWSPDTSDQIPEIVRAPDGLFIGELGFAYVEERLSDGDYDQKMLGLPVRPLFREVNSNFGKDFSGDELALLAPSKELLAEMGARWDGNRAWRDHYGTVLALHVEAKDFQGLVVRKEPLEAALRALKLSLVWSMWANRTATNGSFQQQLRLFRLRRGHLLTVWSKVEGSPALTEGDEIS